MTSRPLPGAAWGDGGRVGDDGVPGPATAPTRSLSPSHIALAVIGVGVVAVCVRLAWAFVGSDFTLSLVAENSRADAPWYYRLAALWGNAPGSLLVFAAIVGVVAARAVWRDAAGSRLVVAAVTAALGGLALVAQWPFARPDIPALGGFGLTPILEHPAMAIHPPLLYLGLALALPPFAFAVGSASLDPVRSRRSFLAAFSILTAAMTLGAWWSYAEQGWGGYWAWDPVENGSLAPWLGLLVAIHTRRPGRVCVGLPWLLALGGATIARSGAARSVHSFAESPAIGWSLAALTAGSAIVLVLAARRANACSPLAEASSPLADTSLRRADVGREVRAALSNAGAADGGAEPSAVERHDGRGSPVRWLAFPRVLAGAALLVVIVGTVFPLVVEVGGARERRVGGEFFARLTLPMALLAAGLALWVSRRARLRRLTQLGHAGFAILLVGVIGSSFDRSAIAAVGAGERVTIAGVEVIGGELIVSDGPVAGSSAIRAPLRVAGRRVEPVIIAYPARGGLLAETGLIAQGWRDIQVVLLDASDDQRAVVEVRTKPLVILVWLGALIIAVSTALATRAAGRPAKTPTGSTADSTTGSTTGSTIEASDQPDQTNRRGISGSSGGAGEWLVPSDP